MMPMPATTVSGRRPRPWSSIRTVLLFVVFGSSVIAAWSPRPDDIAKRREQYSAGELNPAQDPLYASVPSLGHPTGVHDAAKSLPSSTPPTLDNTLPLLLDAIEVMQSHFFELWQGTWPKAIDWTAAVTGTHIAATLSTFTKSLDYNVFSAPGGATDALSAVALSQENIVNKYFSQLTAFYFGENAFAIRMQAYDDMLWVVLDWLENIKLINLHIRRHYTMFPSLADSYNSSDWYAAQFIPSFAHRARIFYDLASHGWNTSLCGGGMIWNQYLTPYKNAITNELFITASVGMYLHFPGDLNSSPFSTAGRTQSRQTSTSARPHDAKYLKAAIEGYKWLSTSNMTNSQGLFTDGFHIRGWRGGTVNRTIGSGQCDIRNEMVYTYNQGVILSGLRGLWESTGAGSYLEDGHKLIRNVIVATGWHEKDHAKRQRWAGLGRNGVLEEACDASGLCSQDGQTFKGIFFHHLALFCAPLPTEPMIAGVTATADRGEWNKHESSCEEYVAWVTHNAEAAVATRNEDGMFGMWWGIMHDMSNGSDEDLGEHIASHAVDYRNTGVPDNSIWRRRNQDQCSAKDGMDSLRVRPGDINEVSGVHKESRRDWNDRGRGRTVETQGGGVAVLRALYELTHR